MAAGPESSGLRAWKRRCAESRARYAAAAALSSTFDMLETEGGDEALLTPACEQLTMALSSSAKRDVAYSV